MAWILFVCFAYLVGTFPGAFARPAVTAISDRVGRGFLRLNERYAEPSAGANRAEPLGLALGFLVCSCQFSGRSAGSFGGAPHDEIRVYIRASCLWFSSDLLLDGWGRTGDHRVNAAWSERLAPYRFDFRDDRYYPFSQVSLLEQTRCR